MYVPERTWTSKLDRHFDRASVWECEVMQAIRVYSDVVKQDLFLPRKEKYTMRDVNEEITRSLFLGRGKTLTIKQARFIVKCSAVFHNTDCSKSVEKSVS